MKKTLFRTSVFLLLVLSVDFAASLVLGYMYENNYLGQSGGEINYYLKEKKDIQHLFIGSSRVRHNVNITTDQFYNLAHNGMHFPFQKGVIKILEHKEALPQGKLYLNIEVEDFNIRNAARISEHISYLKYYYREIEYIQQEIDKIEPTHRLKQLSQLYKFNGNFISLLKNFYFSKSQSNWNSNGYVAIEPTPMDSMRLKATVTSSSNEVIQWNTALFKSLKTLQDDLNQKGVELVLFTAPYFNDSNPYQSFKEELKKHGISNYSSFEHITALKQSHLWTDNSHLNALGAELFSNHLKYYYEIE